MTSANGPSGAELARSVAMTARPTSAIAPPTSCVRGGRSPSASAAKATVKMTCVCSTSEDRPAGMPWSMPTNSSPKLSTPSEPPTATTQYQRTRGGPTKKTAGTATSAKRSAENKSGGKCSSPTWMTTKFTPHTAAMTTASAVWRAVMDAPV